MKFFRSALYRAFFSRMYLIQLASALLVSSGSVFFLKMLEREMRIVPREMLETLKIGANYNIGIVAVSDLYSLNGAFHDDIVRGIFAGSFSVLLILFIAVSFMCSEFQSGYVRTAVMKGQSRIRICLQYMLITVLICLPAMMLEMAGVIISLGLNNMLYLSDIAGILVNVGMQMLMLCSLAICSTCFAVMTGKRDAKIFVMFAGISLPIIPGYLYLMTNGSVRIEKWLLISQMIASGNMTGNQMAKNFLLAVGTVVAFSAVAMILFRSRNIE